MISQELIAKQRREGMRWNIINTLNKARPHTTSETFLLDIPKEKPKAYSSVAPTA